MNGEMPDPVATPFGWNQWPSPLAGSITNYENEGVPDPIPILALGSILHDGGIPDLVAILPCVFYLK